MTSFRARWWNTVMLSYFLSLLFAVLGVNYNEALWRDFAQAYYNDKTSISDAVQSDRSIAWSSFMPNPIAKSHVFFDAY